MKVVFQKVADFVSSKVGTPTAFLLAICVVVLWAISGPLFRFSNTWQLIINTSTTIVTFWLVFIIQSTQIKDTRAIQLKLDELLEDIDGVKTDLVGVENNPKRMTKELD